MKNAALLFKWWWRYACEEGILWRKIVNSIHEEDLALLSDNSVSNTRSLARDPETCQRREPNDISILSEYKITVR